MKNKILTSLSMSLLLMSSCTKDMADSVLESIQLNTRAESTGPTEAMIVLEGQTEKPSSHTVIFYDPHGKEIHRATWTLSPGLNSTQLNLPELAEPGVYLIKVIDKSGAYQLEKVSLHN